MENGEDASTSKMDEEVLPPISWVQDSKHKPWNMSPKKRISLLKGLRDQLESAPSNLEDRRVISRPSPTFTTVRKQYKLFAHESASTTCSLALEHSKLHAMNEGDALRSYSSHDLGSLRQAIPEKHLRIAPFKGRSRLSCSLALEPSKLHVRRE